MRRDLITRTISGTKVTVKVINSNTDEISTKEILFSKVVKEKDQPKEAAKQLAEDEVLVSIVASEQIDKLYGIAPTDFMAHAIELDPATREAIKPATTDAE